MKNVFIIAEAGVNHNGSEELALRLIDVASESGADAIKFQTFKAEQLTTKLAEAAEYQKSQGDSDQFSMLKRLEISDNLHHKLVKHCNNRNIEFMSTPFDIDSAHLLNNLGMHRFKVSSGELTNLPFIRQLASFDKPIILSTGMASLNEVHEAVSTVIDAREILGFVKPLAEMLTVLHCTSNYPAAYEDVNLRAIKTMSDALGLPIGYSDHTNGVFVSPLAVSIGATVIEKHFTLDRSLPGPDHLASLEPDELKQMVSQIRSVEACLGTGEKAPAEKELPIRELVRRSVTLVVAKNKGDILQKSDLALLRPGSGIEPKAFDSVVGRCLQTNLSAGSTLSWADLADA